MFNDNHLFYNKKNNVRALIIMAGIAEDGWLIGWMYTRLHNVANCMRVGRVRITLC